jgi:hypothetical protein
VSVATLSNYTSWVLEREAEVADGQFIAPQDIVRLAAMHGDCQRLAHLVDGCETWKWRALGERIERLRAMGAW